MQHNHLIILLTTLVAASAAFFLLMGGPVEAPTAGETAPAVETMDPAPVAPIATESGNQVPTTPH
jgi:hypothetical protein